MPAQAVLVEMLWLVVHRVWSLPADVTTPGFTYPTSAHWAPSSGFRHSRHQTEENDGREEVGMDWSR